MFQEFSHVFNSVSRVIQELFKSCSRVVQELFKCCAELCKSVSRVFTECFMFVSRMFQKFFKTVCSYPNIRLVLSAKQALMFYKITDSHWYNYCFTTYCPFVIITNGPIWIKFYVYNAILTYHHTG